MTNETFEKATEIKKEIERREQEKQYLLDYEMHGIEKIFAFLKAAHWFWKKGEWSNEFEELFDIEKEDIALLENRRILFIRQSNAEFENLTMADFEKATELNKEKERCKKEHMWLMDGENAFACYRWVFGFIRDEVKVEPAIYTPAKPNRDNKLTLDKEDVDLLVKRRVELINQLNSELAELN